MATTFGHRSTNSESALFHGYHPVSPPADQPERYNRVRVQKHRRASSTGGGRAWTEEEEAYLLRTRMHKMPYKYIATHLRKSELACRLHYHQMSYGSNRRKRNESVSSVCSSGYGSLTGGRENSPDRTPFSHLSPVQSPAPSSPESLPLKNGAGSTAPGSPQSRGHIPILPKPSVGLAHLQAAHAPLHLDTSSPILRRHSLSGAHVGQVDMGRLNALYEARRNQFWSAIASDYSLDYLFTGQQLEEAFLVSMARASPSRAPSPPTPDQSPGSLSRPSFTAPVYHSPEAGGFQAINNPTPTSSTTTSSPSVKCSVSSLLTDEKEVRVPNRGSVC